MLNLDGQFRSHMAFDPSYKLNQDQEEILFYISCFTASKRKLSLQEMTEKAQSIADHILGYYLANKETIDAFYSCRHQEGESNFTIADKIFRMMMLTTTRS